MMDLEGTFHSIKEFAKKLSVHHNTVRRAIKSGRIHAIKIGQGKRAIYRIPYNEISRMSRFNLDEYIEDMVKKRSKKQNQEINHEI